MYSHKSDNRDNFLTETTPEVDERNNISGKKVVYRQNKRIAS